MREGVVNSSRAQLESDKVSDVVVDHFPLLYGRPAIMHETLLTVTTTHSNTTVTWMPIYITLHCITALINVISERAETGAPSLTLWLKSHRR